MELDIGFQKSNSDNVVDLVGFFDIGINVYVPYVC